MIDYSDHEIEDDRLHSIRELPEKYEETMDQIHQRYENPIGYSEVFHLAFMLMESVETYMMDSPAVLFDASAYTQAHKASTALFNLYQRLGALRAECEDRDVEAVNTSEEFEFTFDPETVNPPNPTRNYEHEDEHDREVPK
jgi:hypothetical protein